MGLSTPGLAISGFTCCPSISLYFVYNVIHDLTNSIIIGNAFHMWYKHNNYKLYYGIYIM